MNDPRRRSASPRTPGSRPPRWCAALLGFLAIAIGPVLSHGASSSPEQIEFFEKKIRPVLVAECYECHGSEKQKGGLRLDSREGVLKGGDTGPSIVPGKPDDSLLIQSITHADADLKMPSKAPKLEDGIIADFVEWVKMGAPDSRVQPDAKSGSPAEAWAETMALRRQWWSFQPVTDPVPPQPKNSVWSQHPVDRFLLKKMETRGLAPSPDADDNAVIRRLSYVLTGLPPTLKETETFLSAATEHRQTAIREAVDRLLDSPAFGERWARHWMDLVRYSETYGSEHDYLNPHAWRYRDYLIRAFNDDLPYDRFVQEQIAGDLLEPRWNRGLGINEAKLATAWHRMIESYASPVDVKREEATVIDWQIEAMGKSFLGLTIQCARCHDHKFDPISDEDFYALYGVFASTRPTLSILDDPVKLTVHDAELSRLKEEIRRALASRWEQDLQPAALAAALKVSLGEKEKSKDRPSVIRELSKAGDFEAKWKEMRKRYVESAQENAWQLVFADFTRGDLSGWRVAGPGLPAAPTPPGVLSLTSRDAIVRAIQPAGFYSDVISERHGGALRSPEFVIDKQSVSVLASGSGKTRLRLVIENFQNDLLLFKGLNPDLGSSTPRWYTMRIKEQWMGRRARIELLTRDDKTCVQYVRDQEAWAKTDGRSAFGVQRVVLHDGNPPPEPSPFPEELWRSNPKNWDDFITHLSATAHQSVKRWGDGGATDDDARLLQLLLDAGVLATKPEDALAARFRDLEERIPTPSRAPGLTEDGYSYDSPMFQRGDHQQPGPVVPRRFPVVLGGALLGGEESGRLELARELTRRDNPLAARVMVNRVWQHLTGRGIVATPDDFGKMGGKPTHPELLDHLATKFMNDGWSVKELIRYIVTARFWQLSTQPGLQAAELDPDNDLLSHARVRRLEAEAIRDGMLAVAGNLEEGHSGPGMRIFYRTQVDPDKQPPAGPIDGGGRRSVYLEARRLFPSEFLATFDAPKPNILTGRRSETNVPAQSLTLLNDPFVLHQAKVWTARMEKWTGSEEDRITRIYLEAFSRAPLPDELESAAAFIRARGNDGWRDLAHAVFNLKEIIYLR